MINGLTKTELNKALELLSLCEDYYVFQYDDLIVKGEKVDVVKQYVKAKPSSKFRIWLIQSGLVVEYI